MGRASTRWLPFWTILVHSCGPSADTGCASSARERKVSPLTPRGRQVCRLRRGLPGVLPPHAGDRFPSFPLTAPSAPGAVVCSLLYPYHRDGLSLPPSLTHARTQDAPACGYKHRSPAPPRTSTALGASSSFHSRSPALPETDPQRPLHRRIRTLAGPPQCAHMHK